MNRSIIRSFFALLLILAAASCDRDRKHPGWDYFPDMAYSNAYETYSPNEVFADGKTNQSPVEGTVSRDALPFAYGTSTEERTRAGRELINPVRSNRRKPGPRQGCLPGILPELSRGPG